MKYRPFLAGCRFGNLVVLSVSKDTDDNYRRKCICKCDCGIVKEYLVSNVKEGKSSSCGCKTRDNARKSNTKHGLSDTSEYNSWNTMIQRCTNPKNEKYPYYGGRGISVYPPWVDSFEEFYKYIGPKPSPNHSLDRWPNNETGNYEPGNLRWGTDEQQRRNKRSNVWIEYNGIKMIMSDWAISLGMTPQLFWNRLKIYTMEEIMAKFKK